MVLLRLVEVEVESELTMDMAMHAQLGRRLRLRAALPRVRRSLNLRWRGPAAEA
ncbi:MAG: hypothetical protein JXX28_04760 [Deltaproteobacteria bacterium]|nr:hypothetical protein [Deltaproteobacteria bacterium]